MSDKIKRTIGWNSSYFGEPKQGSLAATIADITSKQNELVGGKPEVQDSMAVTAAKEARTQKEEVKKDKKEEDEEDMAQKDAKTKDKGNVKIHGEKFEQAKQFSVASMKEALAKVYAEAARNKEEGNAFTKSLMAAKEKGEKTFTVAGKQYNVEQELDKVNPVAVKKKFDDRKDKDIDNDGDVDSSDKYLHKRRQAISKAVK